MGLARLVPGVHDQRGAELAVQMRLTTREACRADSATPQAQEGAFGAQEEGLEGMRHGTHRVAGGGGAPRRLPRGHPLGRGPRLTCGTGAMPARARGRARNAARRTPPMPLLGRATGHEGVEDCVLDAETPERCRPRRQRAD